MKTTFAGVAVVVEEGRFLVVVVLDGYYLSQTRNLPYETKRKRRNLNLDMFRLLTYLVFLLFEYLFLGSKKIIYRYKKGVLGRGGEGFFLLVVVLLFSNVFVSNFFSFESIEKKKLQ